MEMGEALQAHEAGSEFGEALAQGEFERAAEKLGLDAQKMRKGELSEQHRQAARLRAMAQRMRAAGQQGRQGQQSRQRQSQTAQNPSGQNPQGARNDQMGQSGLMADVQDMEDALRDWQEALDEQARRERQLGEQGGEQGQGGTTEQQGDRAGQSLNRFGDRLGRNAQRQRLSRQMRGMRRTLSQGQGWMSQASQVQSLASYCATCNGQAPGGQQAGEGTSNAQNNQTDPAASGQADQLTGQIGATGESDTSTETAESGTASSGRKHVAQKREFRKQLESYVQREDIPESLKRGVQQYFATIHQNQNTDSSSPDETP